MLPKVQVSPDQEAISIIGKGSPLIYLGNQRITVADLNSLAVESIRDIQIINNPSAKYEAEGRAVVLIARKPNLSNGYQLSLIENASFKRKFNNYASLNASFKKEKLELRTNVAFNSLTPWESVQSVYELQLPDGNPSYENISLSIGSRPQYILGGGIFYQLKEGDYISANANIRAHQTTAPLITLSFVQSEKGLDRVYTHLDDSEQRGFFTSNVNYNKKMKASNLFMGLQYSRYYRDLKSDIFNSYDNQGLEEVENRTQEFQIDGKAARMDFERSFANDGKWEIGWNISAAVADAFSDFYFIPSADNLVRNYDYQEANYAGYTQWSGKAKTWSYSAGLRTEYTRIEGGFQESDTLLVNRKRTVFFPKAMLNIPIDSTKTLTFNYSKTIRRPNYLNSSSISTYLNPFLEYTRNVNLKPTQYQEISANFQYKDQSLTLGYILQKDPNFTSVVFDTVQQRIISSPENYDQESTFRMALTSPSQYKFWTSTNVLVVGISKIQDARALVKSAQPYIYAYTNNQFQLKPKTVLGFNFWVLSNRDRGTIQQKAMFALNATVSQTFFKKLKATLQFNDVFRGREFEQGYTINRIAADNVFFGDTKILSFSLRYSFGHIAKSVYQNRDVDGNLERIN